MRNQNFISPTKAFICWAALVFLLCPYGRVAAAQSSAGFGHQAWISDNGLPQNSVHQVLQTRDGFLWIATEGGVARFNGFDFQTFSKENNPAFASDDVCCLAEDASGTLWVGASDRLLRFDGGRFLPFAPLNDLHSGEIIELLPGHDGALFVLTSQGLVRITNGRITNVSTAPYAIPSIATSGPDGKIWLASDTQLLEYEAGGVRLERSLPLSPFEAVLSMQVQTDGTLWLRTARRILKITDKPPLIWVSGKDLPGTRTESLWIDADGFAWIGTNRGLVTIAPTNEVSHTLEAIGVNSVLSVVGDHEGNIWVGTETVGLHILRPQQFHTQPALADEVITAVVQAKDGTIWMGTREDGLRRYRSEKIDIPKESSELASQIVLALAPGLHGDLWVGTPDGLNHIEGAKVSLWSSANGLPDDFVRSLLVDDDGSIWAGTRRGVAHWKDGRVIETYTSADGLRSELIGALLRTTPDLDTPNRNHRDLWIATLQGLSRLRDGRITTYTRADGLAGDVVTSLAQDRTGAIWIGARDGGLTRYTDGVFRAFRQAALPQEVESIVPDGLGYLWLASKRGVDRVDLSSFAACAGSLVCSPSVSQYGYSNGLPSEEASAIGHPSSWRTTAGELWFATRKGVAIVDPTHLREKTTRFPVAIERFIVDDVEQPKSASELKIPAGHSSFNIQYVGLDYSAPSRIRYRYQLEGLDKHWNDAGMRRTAYYTNLPPGSYRFRVEAVGSEGDWGGNAAEFRFRVLPPFYRRIWFYLLCTLLVSAIIYLAYRLRLRRLTAQFSAVLAERSRIAREIHDTLAQSFVGISIHLELVAQSLSRADVSTANRQIQTTQKLVRDGLTDARQSIWELRTIASQDSLPTRLAKIVELAMQQGSAARLEISGSYRALSPKLEGEILRVSQEALANALRHAGAKSVIVGLQYCTDELILTIVDDGKGFNILDTPTEENHFGLQGMRERAANIGGKIKVQSIQGEGTQISLIVRI